MEIEQCDVLIIGCGPSGSTTAKKVVDKGYKVLIIEKKQKVGEPVQCAEYIPKLITQHIKLDRNSITNNVNSMKTHMPNGEINGLKTPGYIVNRAIFDKNLASYASESGAKILLGTKAEKFSNNNIIAKRGNTEIKINPKIIIGADGPKSNVGSWINQKNFQFIVAKQYEMILTEYQDYTDVYFDEKFNGGYAWVFPKGKYANVGIGINSFYSRNLSKILDDFVKKLIYEKKILPHSIVKKTAGLIPINGPLHKTVIDNIILVGDAAGFTHPITGAGILNAVISGSIAGEIVNNALKSENIDILNTYNLEWESLIGSSLRMALKRRKLYDDFFANNISKFQNFNEVLQKCWVAFRGYYDDD